VSLLDFQESPERYSVAALYARNNIGHADCLCRTPNPKLVIAMRAGRFYIAGWPNDGHLHDARCTFFKSKTRDSGLDAYSKESLIQKPDGSFNVRLNQPFSIEVGADVRSSAPVKSPMSGGNSSRRTSSLLGFLHFLWEESNLNRWYPSWRRDWFLVRRHLYATLSKGISCDRELSRAVYVVPKYSQRSASYISQAWERWAEPLTASAMAALKIKEKKLSKVTRIQTGIIMGRLKQVEKNERGYVLKLKDHPHPIYASKTIVESIERQFGDLSPKPDVELIVMAMVLPSAKGYFSLIDMAVMRTTTAFMPGDSSYEVALAKQLVADGRHFSKPLRYDSRDAVFPDFVLHDTGDQDTIMEIYGMAGNKTYESRKKEKQGYYRKSGAKIWEWDLTQDKAAPPFPPKVG
jgi:hypothetical protein